MADWTDTATLIASLAAGKAFTDEKAQALAENVDAVSEGALNAPRVQGKALGSVFIGQGDSGGSTEVSFTNLDAMERLLVDVSYANKSSASNPIQVAFSNNNGSSYGSYQTVLTGGQAGFGTFRLSLNLRTGVCSGHGVAGSTGTVAYSFSASSLPLTVPSGCNAIRLRVNNSGGNQAFSAWCLGGLEA